MSLDITTRRLYPVYLSSDAQYLILVANDTKDNLQKQFILANLQLKPNRSLLDEYRKNQKLNHMFNYKRFKQSEEGRFQRPEIVYKIRITNFSLE